MKIELIKNESVLGNPWWAISVNGVFQFPGFHSEEEAIIKYYEAIAKAKNGFPKTTIVHETEIY